MPTTSRKPRRADKLEVPIDTGKIRSLREGLGLTLAAAAEKAGFENRQQWYQIESGVNSNPKLETIERIARALNVRARDLLTD